jgi:malonate decarboxylase alpha subunit
MVEWNKQKQQREGRLAAGAKFARGKLVEHAAVTALLEALIHPGDRICLEGDNQKQADFLAACLAEVNPRVLHDLHVEQSGIVLPEHIDLFEKGIAKRLDYSYSGPQSFALSRALKSGKIELGAIHTYIELFARYFVDLTPHVALTVARSADREGNLYMGPNTEDSPVVIEATAFKSGIVVAQVNEIVEKLPRVDVPGDRVDFVVVAPKPYYVEPLFTRDPAKITEMQILAAMMAIKGIYAEYGHWFQHRCDRAPASDLRGQARAQRQDRHSLGAQPTSHVNSCDRIRVGRTDPLLWFRGWHGCLHARPVRHLFHRAGRFDEL